MYITLAASVYQCFDSFALQLSLHPHQDSGLRSSNLFWLQIDATAPWTDLASLRHCFKRTEDERILQLCIRERTWALVLLH